MLCFGYCFGLDRNSEQNSYLLLQFISFYVHSEILFEKSDERKAVIQAMETASTV